MTANDFIRRKAAEAAAEAMRKYKTQSGSQQYDSRSKIGCFNADRTKVHFPPDIIEYPVTVIGQPGACAPVSEVSPGQFVATGPMVAFTQVDSSKGDVFVIETDDDSVDLWVRSIENNNRYKIKDLNKEWLSGSFPDSPHNKPCFSPSGRHIFIPFAPEEGPPYGVIKFNIIKNWKFKTDPDSGEKYISGTTTEHEINIMGFMSSLKEGDEPPTPKPETAPTITTSYVRTSNTFGGDPVVMDPPRSLVYQDDPDPGIAKCFPEDITLIKFGPWENLTTNLDHRIPTPETGLFGSGFCRYWFTEDSDGNPKVDLYSQYEIKRKKHKNYSLLNYGVTGEVGACPYYAYYNNTIPSFGTIIALFNEDNISLPIYPFDESGTVEPLFNHAMFKKEVPELLPQAFHAGLAHSQSSSGGAMFKAVANFRATGGINPATGSVGELGSFGVYHGISTTGSPPFLPANYDWSKYRKLVFFARFSNGADNPVIPANSIKFIVNPQAGDDYGFLGSYSVSAPRSEYTISHPKIEESETIDIRSYEVDFGGQGPSQVQAISLEAATTIISATTYTSLGVGMDYNYLLTNINYIPIHGAVEYDSNSGSITLCTVTLGPKTFYISPTIMDGHDAPSPTTGFRSENDEPTFVALYGGLPVVAYKAGTEASPIITDEYLTLDSTIGNVDISPGNGTLAYRITFRTSAFTRGIVSISNLQDGGTVSSVELGYTQIGNVINSSGGFQYGPPGASVLQAFQTLTKQDKNEGIKIFRLLDGYSSSSKAGSGTASVIKTSTEFEILLNIEYRSPAISTVATELHDTGTDGLSSTSTDGKFIPPPDWSIEYPDSFVRQYDKYLWEGWLIDNGDNKAEFRRIEYDGSKFDVKIIKGKKSKEGYKVVDWVQKKKLKDPNVPA